MAVDALTRFINVSDGDTFRDTSTLIVKNVWNSFRLRFDYATRTFSVYVNGNVAASGLRFATGANSVFGDADIFNDNRVDPAGNDTAHFDNFTVRVAEPTAAVSGTVLLENYAAPAGTPISFLFRPTDNTPTFTRNATLSATGEFQIADVPRKNYIVHVDGAKWLARNVAVNATTGNVSGLLIELRGGDANGDNIVDVDDLSALITAFDADPNSANWNSSADFDGNQIVDVDDLAILIRNFDAEGDA
jgi:hypothetical protein